MRSLNLPPRNGDLAGCRHVLDTHQAHLPPPFTRIRSWNEGEVADGKEPGMDRWRKTRADRLTLFVLLGEVVFGDVRDTERGHEYIGQWKNTLL